MAEAGGDLELGTEQVNFDFGLKKPTYGDVVDVEELNPEDAPDDADPEGDDGDGPAYTIAAFLNRKLSLIEKLRGNIEKRGVNTGGWGVLPDICIEKIFSYLSISDKYSSSLVCRQWQRAFYLQASWHTFELQDSTLTRNKFNYYMGWQQILDHLRTQICIFRIGRFIRSLILSPMTNLFNLYEFMNMLSYFVERHEQDETGPTLKINSLRFIFRCDMHVTAAQEHFICGTGGKLLESLKRLMTNFKHLKTLELFDLLLDSSDEAIHLLDDVVMSLCEKLDTLILINLTKTQFYFLHPACFVNLRILKISPQNLGDEMLDLLRNNQRMRELHIIMNNYTEPADLVPRDRKVWAKAKYKVFMRNFGKSDKEMIWQDGAPVVSILYESPYTKLSWTSILTVVELYSHSLEEYGHFGLPRFGRGRKFEERPDQALVTLCKNCPYLTVLIIRERISTCTALLITALSINLQQFYIRRNGLILKCDYLGHNLELGTDFVHWLKRNSKSYERTSREISKALGHQNWKPLTDIEFKDIGRRRQAY